MQWLLVGLGASFISLVLGVVGFLMTLLNIPTHEPLGFILDIVGAADTLLGIVGMVGMVSFGAAVWMKTGKGN